MWGLACAAASLPAGFAVAAATDVRPLGGGVLLALAVLAGRALPGGLGRELAWYLVAGACFAASHVLADAAGAWGAVAVVTAVASAAYAILARFAVRRSDSD